MAKYPQVKISSHNKEFSSLKCQQWWGWIKGKHFSSLPSSTFHVDHSSILSPSTLDIPSGVFTCLWTVLEGLLLCFSRWCAPSFSGMLLRYQHLGLNKQVFNEFPLSKSMFILDSNCGISRKKKTATHSLDKTYFKEHNTSLPLPSALASMQ